MFFVGYLYHQPGNGVEGGGDGGMGVESGNGAGGDGDGFDADAAGAVLPGDGFGSVDGVEESLHLQPLRNATNNLHCLGCSLISYFNTSFWAGSEFLDEFVRLTGFFRFL